MMRTSKMKGLTGRLVWLSLVVVLSGVMAVSSHAAFTSPINPGSAPLLGAGGILDTLYGLSNLTRVHDFGFVPNDQVWWNPNGHAAAQARYASLGHDFGYLDNANNFVSLFTINSGFGFLSGSPSAMFPLGPFGFRFALKTTQGNLFSSRIIDNADLLDHMITFKITGNIQGQGDYVICWEDLTLPYVSDRDFNDLVVQVHGVYPGVPEPATLAMVGMGALALGVRRFRRA